MKARRFILILIVILFLAILGVLGVLIWQSLEREEEVDAKGVFLEYFALNFEGLLDGEVLAGERKGIEDHEIETSIRFERGSLGSVEVIELRMLEQRSGDVYGLSGVVNHDDEEILELELFVSQDGITALVPQIIEVYLEVENRDLNELAELMGIQFEDIPSEIDIESILGSRNIGIESFFDLRDLQEVFDEGVFTKEIIEPNSKILTLRTNRVGTGEFLGGLFGDIQEIIVYVEAERLERTVIVFVDDEIELRRSANQLTIASDEEKVIRIGTTADGTHRLIEVERPELTIEIETHRSFGPVEIKEVDEDEKVILNDLTEEQAVIVASTLQERFEEFLRENERSIIVIAEMLMRTSIREYIEDFAYENLISGSRQMFNAQWEHLVVMPQSSAQIRTMINELRSHNSRSERRISYDVPENLSSGGRYAVEFEYEDGFISGIIVTPW